MWDKHKNQRDTRTPEATERAILPSWWVHLAISVTAAGVALLVFFGDGSSTKPSVQTSLEDLKSCASISGGEAPQKLRELILTTYVNQLTVEIDNGGGHPLGTLKEQVSINKNWEVSMPDNRRVSLEAGRRLINHDLARAWLGLSVVCNLTEVANTASPALADMLAKMAIALSDATLNAAAEDGAKFRTDSKPTEGVSPKPTIPPENKKTKPNTAAKPGLKK